MEISKSKRREIYADALNQLTFLTSYDDKIGLCYILKTATERHLSVEEGLHELQFVGILSFFPEVEEQKPSSPFNAGYWFNPNDINSRIKILENAIAKLDKSVPSFKMKVTPKQSEQVQRICFKNGIVWNGPGAVIRKADIPYLIIKNGFLYWTDSFPIYEDQNFPELIFEEFIKIYDKPNEDGKKNILMIVEAAKRGYFSDDYYFNALDGWHENAYFKLDSNGFGSKVAANYIYDPNNDSLSIPVIGVRGNISACRAIIYEKGKWANIYPDPIPELTRRKSINKENEQMKTITIELSAGQTKEFDETGTITVVINKQEKCSPKKKILTFEEIVKDEIGNDGYYLTPFQIVKSSLSGLKNPFADHRTEKEARKTQLFIQLQRIASYYNEKYAYGWKADWNNTSQVKYFMLNDIGTIKADYTFTNYGNPALFATKELLQLAYDNNKAIFDEYYSL